MTEKEKTMAYDKAIRKSLIVLLKHFCNGYRIPWLNPPVSYKEMLNWLEKQDEQTLPQTNERTWLYLISDVLTWKDGIGQHLDDTGVQELAKRLCNKYAHKLYDHSVISNSSNTETINKKPTDKIEPKFKVGDWIVFVKSGSTYQVEKIENYEYTLRHVFGGLLCLPFSNEKLIREWTIQDAKDGDVLVCNDEILLFKSYSEQGKISLYCWYNEYKNMFVDKEIIDISLTTKNKICPATKKQHDILYQKIKERKEKFNPKTLKPFDKVLVRDRECSIWKINMFSYIYDNTEYPYDCFLGSYRYCIPYNDDTKYLVGTTEEAPEYYKQYSNEYFKSI